MNTEDRIYQEALSVATMYYYQGLTTEAIAREMNFSRPKVSRLLSHARSSGMVEIKIVNVQKALSPLERQIRDTFGLDAVHIVPAPELMGEVVWLERVARYTANYLNSVLSSGDILAIAWGTTISEIASNLIPHRVPELRVVQLNGSGNTFTPDNRYAANILHHFAQNYEANVMLFPVPTFFDYRETKAAMWQERSVKRIIDLQQNASVLLYSIGSVNAGVPSHVYSTGYLDPEDMEELEREQVIGDLATVFFREDGSWEDIPLNSRASGPPLSLYRKVKRAICVVSGRNKVPGLRAALKARLMSELILDEPTARLLCRSGDCGDLET
ncbi:DNA-binding transcriptional regulator LsrR, DeoR family [Alkalispirochaeta americana]|uniref:DNA-binding transcriptional regulator LsrR, DeoR family n=1 Tax=Alkalispirochaeta americana TaxID=159291 RepID=A0A1N6V7I3_9SPIO|nr:sugar-binding domain-containing protein [Alkalispirochaeta americana]SIQ73772.1 DNA-binding transcriptional regulator LsrR, DeoR family [Alkalispirochaeta americana]